jgi:hypothetical protein
VVSDVEGPIDRLFCADGPNGLDLDVLTVLEGRLADRAVVVADLRPDDPDLVPYLERVRSPNGGFVRAALPVETGFEVSVRASRGR